MVLENYLLSTKYFLVKYKYKYKYFEIAIHQALKYPSTDKYVLMQVQVPSTSTVVDPNPAGQVIENGLSIVYMKKIMTTNIFIEPQKPYN